MTLQLESSTRHWGWSPSGCYNPRRGGGRTGTQQTPFWRLRGPGSILILAHKNYFGSRKSKSPSSREGGHYQGTVDALPEDMTGLIVASDLQGRDRHQNATGERRLLGEVLAEELRALSDFGDLPPVNALGVLLAGDLYSRPSLDRRGGSGDVRQVWNAFAEVGFRWITGVAGNHDVFGEKPSVPDFHAFLREPGIHFLDGSSVELDGLRIAGVSGVVGNPRRNFRRAENDYVETVYSLAEHAPDILVLHDGPAIPDRGLLGCQLLTEMLELLRPTLIVRGHAAWDPWFVELKNGTQVVNVDAKVLLLTRKESNQGSGGNRE